MVGDWATPEGQRVLRYRAIQVQRLLALHAEARRVPETQSGYNALASLDAYFCWGWQDEVAGVARPPYSVRGTSRDWRTHQARAWRLGYELGQWIAGYADWPAAGHLARRNPPRARPLGFEPIPRTRWEALAAANWHGDRARRTKLVLATPKAAPTQAQTALW